MCRRKQQQAGWSEVVHPFVFVLDATPQHVGAPIFSTFHGATVRLKGCFVNIWNLFCLERICNLHLFHCFSLLLLKWCWNAAVGHTDITYKPFSSENWGSGSRKRSTEAEHILNILLYLSQRDWVTSVVRPAFSHFTRFGQKDGFTVTSTDVLSSKLCLSEKGSSTGFFLAINTVHFESPPAVMCLCFTNS